jgi:hypothetical protein
MPSLSTTHESTGAWKWTPEAFWKMADSTRMLAEYSVDQDLRYLRVAPLDVLQKIFVQYRFFTLYYITDLALLVSRLPFGALRSALAEFLNDELGNGDPSQAHPRLYDDFLLSLGIHERALRASNAKNIAILEGVQRSLQTRSWAYGIGLRGMGGECLCQLYLASMQENFMQNPFIRERRNGLAWKFWDIHTGDVDIHHRERTRDAINELLVTERDTIVDLASGYAEAKGAWDRFWKNIYQAARR